MKPAFVRIDSLMTDTFKQIEKLYEKKQAVTGVPTGFADLDRMTAGLQPSDLDHHRRTPEHGKDGVRA